MNINRKIELKLENDISLIKEEIFKKINSSNVKSIFLYGGYGRDEGSWVIENDDVRPYNDYDIAIMVDRKVHPRILKSIEKALKKKVEVRWIDICQYRKVRLKLFRISIRNYDFKYASKCIYGEENFLRHIPNMDAGSIPLKDIDTLYKTRLWTLIGSFPLSGLKEMPNDDEMLFRNQMAKCVLAIVDCILIQKNKYNPSYIERVNIISSSCEDKKLVSLANWALKEKLRPKYKGMKEEEIIEKYTSIRSLFFKYFFEGLSSYYKTSIEKPGDLNKYILYTPMNLIKENIKFYIFGNQRDKKQKYLTIIQGYIAYYYPNIPPDLNQEIETIMSEKFQFKSNDLEKIRLKVAELRVTI